MGYGRPLWDRACEKTGPRAPSPLSLNDRPPVSGPSHLNLLLLLLLRAHEFPSCYVFLRTVGRQQGKRISRGMITSREDRGRSYRARPSLLAGLRSWSTGMHHRVISRRGIFAERHECAEGGEGNAHIFETKRSLLTGLRPLPLGASVLRGRGLVSEQKGGGNSGLRRTEED